MIGWDTIHAFAEYLHWVQLPRVWIREVSCHCQHIIRCLTRIAGTNNPRRSLKAFYTLGLWGIFLGIGTHLFKSLLRFLHFLYLLNSRTNSIKSWSVQIVHYAVKTNSIKIATLYIDCLKSRSVQNVHFEVRAESTELATCGRHCCHL